MCSQSCRRYLCRCVELLNTALSNFGIAKCIASSSFTMMSTAIGNPPDSDAGGENEQNRSHSNRPISASSSFRYHNVFDSPGPFVLQEHRTSVLSHPLGLPLAVTLHGQSPEDLPYLRRVRRTLAIDDLDHLLELAFQEWTKSECANGAKGLTGLLSTQIAKQTIHTGVYSKTDKLWKSKWKSRNTLKEKQDVILLSRDPDGEEPIAIIRVGTNNEEWWTTFERGHDRVKGLLAPSQEEDHMQKQAILFATLTIESNVKTNSIASKLGIFLCDPYSRRGQYKMALLRYSPSESLGEASKAFGRFLRTSFSFAVWIQDDEANFADYERLSSDCCLVNGTRVSLTCV
jgi:hypothetical protein